MASTRSGTPAPVAAEPAKTGCSSPARVCAATSARSSCGAGARPSTYAVSTASSCSARARVPRSRKARSPGEQAAKPASREPSPTARAHGQDVGCQPAPDRLEHRVDVGAASVDLVDEEQRRHAEALQRAHQDPRLGLDALDGGQDEHGAVEDAEDALDLGDEVGVPGGVDDVDDEVAERERHDRGLDRDAAPALEREAVGAGGAGVDRAGLVDHPGEVQQALGEGGLTGVDVGEDAQVERAWRHAWSLRGGGCGRERALLASRCLLLGRRAGGRRLVSR